MVKTIAKKKKDADNDKKFIGILVPEPIKQKWQEFGDKNNFSTISKLIRKAVNFYVDSYLKISYIEDISKLSHALKEPLTSIKGFSQLITQNYSNKLDLDLLLRIKEITNQCNYLENIIDEIFSDFDQKEYDVLIIEDDNPTIMLLTDFFELRGFNSKSVTSGTKGLEELLRSPPKIILLDIVLPDRNGYEICKMIKFDKNYEQYKDIPIYYITAVPESKVKEKVKETGANGFLLKPFDFEEFEVLFSFL